MPKPRTTDPSSPQQAASPTRTGEPSSVWICPSSPDADWPPEILTEVTTALTMPDEHVLLVHTSRTSALRQARHVVNTLGRSATARQASYTTAAASRHEPHLVLTSTRPDSRDNGALAATVATVADLLPTGGVWAALTHSDTTGGTLRDPTGGLIRTAGAAGLTYLQHIIVAHEPIPTGAEHHSPATEHLPHRRIHRDLLLFTCT